MTKPLIGILALQGCVEPHIPHIEAAGGSAVPVKTLADIAQADGFILPGGESTTMLKLIRTFDLYDSLNEQFTKKPVWGICAGAILMAKEVINPAQDSFSLLDMRAERNAYGRQLESITQDIENYTVSYIRAPRLELLDNSITVKAKRDESPVWVEKNHYMATTFHPELTLDFPSPMHQRFINMVKSGI